MIKSKINNSKLFLNYLCKIFKNKITIYVCLELNTNSIINRMYNKVKINNKSNNK